MRSSTPNLFVLERTAEAPEVIDVHFRHLVCGVCGTRPVARVGSTAVRFFKQAQLVDVTRTAGGLLARHKLLERLTEHLITGWRAGVVRVEAIPSLCDRDLSYSELVIVGHTQCYAERVGLQVDSECSECGRRAYLVPQEGIPMPKECWDGSDIFMIDELPGLTIVTAAVRDLIKQYGHTGVRCTPLTDWRDPLGWMPEKRLAKPPSDVWPPLR